MVYWRFILPPFTILLNMALKITDLNHFVGVASPWVVSEIEQAPSTSWAKIHVTLPDDEKLRGPHCGKECPR